MAWGHIKERLAQRRKERGQASYLALLEEIRPHLGQDETIFERVTCPGRTLCPIGKHPPLAICCAGEIGSVEVEVARLGDGQAVTWA